MNNLIKKRVFNEANYMLNTKKTIREVAKLFNISKSTVHKDLINRLKLIDTNMYQNIQIILKEHIKERHIRGGEATKNKYLKRNYEKV